MRSWILGLFFLPVFILGSWGMLRAEVDGARGMSRMPSPKREAVSPPHNRPPPGKPNPGGSRPQRPGPPGYGPKPPYPPGGAIHPGRPPKPGEGTRPGYPPKPGIGPPPHRPGPGGFRPHRPPRPRHYYYDPYCGPYCAPVVRYYYEEEEYQEKEKLSPETPAVPEKGFSGGGFNSPNLYPQNEETYVSPSSLTKPVPDDLDRYHKMMEAWR